MRVTVKNKIARGDKTVIICNNTDYTVEFLFDDGDWDAYEIKTARFIYAGKYQDVVFTGNSCKVPVIPDAAELSVGVSAGDLRTTTPARFKCQRSILSGDPVHDPPETDVYNQLLEQIRNMSGGGTDIKTVSELDPDAPLNSYQFVEIKGE